MDAGTPVCPGLVAGFVGLGADVEEGGVHEGCVCCAGVDGCGTLIGGCFVGGGGFKFDEVEVFYCNAVFEFTGTMRGGGSGEDDETFRGRVADEGF